MFLLYFLPAIIGRTKRDRAGILLFNLFLGWTGIGWIVALVWACAAEPHARASGPPVAVDRRYCCRCGSATFSGAHFCTGCGCTV
jgi:hypothetical protein